MKRVLFVHLGGGVSGSGESLFQAVRGLHGVESAVYLGSDGALRQRFEAHGTPCRYGPLAHLGHSVSSPLRLRDVARFLWTFRASRRAFAHYVQAVAPDVVYLNTSVLLGPALHARALGLPVVWHVREAIGSGGGLDCLMKKAIQRLATCIIANSDYVAGEFVGSPQPVRVYNGIDLAAFDPQRVARGAVRRALGIPEGAPLIGMVSVIADIKGHFVLLRAAPRILRAFPEARFLIVGGTVLPPGYHQTRRGRLRRALGREADPEVRLRRQIEAAGLSARFILTGFRADIPQVLADLDLLAFPSVVPEGFGRPLAEAGAMAVPVVTTRLGPHGEIVRDGETGVLVAPGDPDALAEGILALLRDPAYARRLGKAARQRVAARFGQEQYIDGIERVLASALTARSRHAEGGSHHLAG
ncbi:MAG: hypothetical protein Kow00120_22710 [Anaerolineae bacterium]